MDLILLISKQESNRAIQEKESEGIKAVKDTLIAEKEATRRRSSSAISSNSNNNDSGMMYYDELEKSC